MKQSLKKRPIGKRGITQNPPTSLELIPASSHPAEAKSLGNPVVELATPTGTINLTEGTNKNESEVKGKVEPLVGWTSR